MSAKPRTTPKDLVLPVPLARRPGAKARMRVICTFVPPRAGDEVHDADGSL